MKDAFFTQVILWALDHFLAYVLVRLWIHKNKENNFKEGFVMKNRTKQIIDGVYRRLITRAERVAVRKTTEMLKAHNMYDEYFYQQLKQVSDDCDIIVHSTGEQEIVLGSDGNWVYSIVKQRIPETMSAKEGGGR